MLVLLMILLRGHCDVEGSKKSSWATNYVKGVSQEHLGAPIYWSPKILFSIFWKGMKRKSYDKTRFCVSREGLPNGLGTFILEPGPHYIGPP